VLGVALEVNVPDEQDTKGWQTPSHDQHKQTTLIQAEIHPGQHRMLTYLTAQQKFGFHSVGAVVRFCVCYGLYAILRRPPHSVTFQQAKHNIDRDEQFDSEVANLTATFHLYVERGHPELARRLVESWYGMASNDPDEYWRDRYLERLKEPLQELKLLEGCTTPVRPCKR
jgi:hypothetical protein